MNIIDRFRLNGKKAYITGGARGIGMCAAEALAQAGADIAIVDRDLEPAQETAKKLASTYGIKTIAVKADVSSEKDVNEMFNSILAAFGTIDVAVNNAGICINKGTAEMTLAEWQKVIDINLTGVYLTSKAAGMVMIKNMKGSIINTGSMAAHVVPEPQCHCAYNASKAGVIHLTKSLACEWAKYKVRVNCVSPGYTATELVKTVASPYWAERTPMKRMGDPEDMQGAFVYLASDASLFTTGIDIIVDGGFCSW